MNNTYRDPSYSFYTPPFTPTKIFITSPLYAQPHKPFIQHTLLVPCTIDPTKNYRIIRKGLQHPPPGLYKRPSTYYLTPLDERPPPLCTNPSLLPYQTPLALQIPPSHDKLALFNISPIRAGHPDFPYFHLPHISPPDRDFHINAFGKYLDENKRIDHYIRYTTPGSPSPPPYLEPLKNLEVIQRPSIKISSPPPSRKDASSQTTPLINKPPASPIDDID